MCKTRSSNIDELSARDLEYLIKFYRQFNDMHLIMKIIDLEHIDTLRDMLDENRGSK